MKKLDAYAKNFTSALVRSGMSSAALAQAIGVDPSYISQWKTGRRPIPADKALQVANFIGADATEISEGFERVMESQSLTDELDNFESKGLIDKKSHVPRFDPKILAATHRGLRKLHAEKGLSYNLEDDPEHFLQAYVLHLELDREAPGADPVGIFRAAGLVTKQGMAEDGRSGDRKAQLPDDGTHTSKVAGKVQRKKGRSSVG